MARQLTAPRHLAGLAAWMTALTRFDPLAVAMLGIAMRSFRHRD